MWAVNPSGGFERASSAEGVRLKVSKVFTQSENLGSLAKSSIRRHIIGDGGRLCGYCVPLVYHEHYRQLDPLEPAQRWVF